MSRIWEGREPFDKGSSRYIRSGTAMAVEAFLAELVKSPIGSTGAWLSAPGCQTFSLSARSKRRRAGRKRAGELAPKLEAAKSHQDGQLSKPSTKTLALRIADPKEDIVRKLASRITDTLVEDLSSPGTNEDEVFA
ncbi:hypothetical protein Pst134EA_007272 [Puccinia striiformis f. sp. tritici]|uniref:Uncharacterized protein n=1 Tax=Puccinia striiformis f. sp. tritici PST-78 TaxID=1165861 RepID=A0A0L0VPC2_9BASI|nr:hypothetical protein Pst134EA_007272 [Puccinia striiformis f. sp. tritici]KAH9470007.1 hypothetical protein Pst134EA_007272 [Puccinia striiformis f. sp. tritici]KAI9626921.1 hypothetical protein KEM48_010104 [Puccinia striiformis f. sp. tritici PST-130]KNF01111.1 hypothetical protein PSTG_05740 [Puccinia striiformis f. sp. tritici PST-78]